MESTKKIRNPRIEFPFYISVIILILKDIFQHAVLENANYPAILKYYESRDNSRKKNTLASDLGNMERERVEKNFFSDLQF